MGWGRARSGHEHSGKMAGAEVEADVRKLMGNLRQLGNELRELGVSVQSSGDYCQRFCQTLVQYAGKWKISEDPLPLLEVYTVAIQNYSKARPFLTAECENVCFVLDRLALQLIKYYQNMGILNFKCWLYLPRRVAFGRTLYLTTFSPKSHCNRIKISAVDCKDALEMICNLESDGEENLALILCTAFLTRQLQEGDLYCAWELTLFWSKLQQRMESSSFTFLECCRQFSMLSKTVYHIFFLIKVIQSEAGEAGLSACIELCVRALRMESNETPSVKTSICKTVSCLLPDYLEVRRACQLTEFLLEPTVEAYYAVETLYNQPDQKYDDENGPIPNSLRCELLLVLKTHWPFDPEFWDWKTLKRHCLALMGEEASIVSSIDELNDSDLFESNESHPEDGMKEHSLNRLPKFYSDVMKVQNGSSEKVETKEKRKMGKGVVSARFKNWQAYMQYCVLCDREFLGHRIIRHAQTHVKDGNYYCPICAKSFKKKEIFVPHVTFHIKQSCKERMASIKPKRRVGRPSKSLIDFSTADKKTAEIEKQEHRPIKRNNLYGEDFVVFSDSDGSDDEGKDKSYKPAMITAQKVDLTEDFNCPVTICTKTFKYFKNLIAHVKGHGNDEEAKRFLKMQSNKVVCQYCRRRFVSVSHLNEHLQIHCGPKPYVCIQLECNASFGTYSELVGHRKDHLLFKAKCMFQNCGRIFTESYLLYDHEAQHYHNSSYTCKFSNCGNIYYSQSELQKHEVGHTTHTCVKVEVENSSSFQADQFASSRVDQRGLLLQIKTEEEPRFESHVYQNGFTIDCVPKETAKPKPTMSEELNVLPSIEEHNHLPKDEHCVTVKNEETASVHLTRSVMPETVCKGEDAPIPTWPAETSAGEASKLVQRFNCKVDGCSRSYTCSRSVNKHIKAAHPEYYEIMKQQQNLPKIQHIRNPLKCQNQEKPSNTLYFPNERISDTTAEGSLNADGATCQLPVSTALTVESENLAQSRKRKHTHNKRAKWPAIIKGDKFICSRCYREFTNPKSLGGHLSRRAICKPYDKKEISSAVNQNNGQALYMAEKILSSDVFTPQAHEPTCISDTFLTGETFLQSLEMGDSTEQFAGHELFPSAQENNYNPSIFEPNTTLPIASLPGTFDSPVIQQTFQPQFEMGAGEENSTNMTISKALTTVCSPRSFVAAEDMPLSTEVPPMLDMSSSTAYSSCEPMQQPLESNFCSGTYVDNEVDPQNLESSCEPSVFFTNDALPEIETSQNSSHSEDLRTLDIRIAEVLLGLQNLNLEYHEKLYTGDAPCQTPISGTPVSSLNIVAHTPMNNCTSGPNIIDQCLTVAQTNTSQQVGEAENEKEVKVNLIKPFICQEAGCIYSAMTKDALTNHYVKVHQYSKEQIMEIKMYQTRFAPFRCHVPNCQKTFTRNSNLRAHYQLVHHVTREELVKLRIKRVYCSKLEGQFKITDSLPSLQEVMPQSAINGTREDEPIALHELETVPPAPIEINAGISLHLHGAHSEKAVLYDQRHSQNDPVLLAGLQDCSPLTAQLQNTVAQPIGPQGALVPTVGSREIPLLLAGPKGGTPLPVAPHSSPPSNEELLAIEPLLPWPQPALPVSMKPQDVSTIPAGLPDIALLTTPQHCASPLPAVPQSIPVPGAPALLPITADVPFRPAGPLTISRILSNPQAIFPLPSRSEDLSLLSMGSTVSLPISVGLLGSSAVSVGLPGASPVSMASSLMSVALPGLSVSMALPGTSPVTMALPGTSPVSVTLPGMPPVSVTLPGMPPMSVTLPAMPPMSVTLPAMPPMSVALAGSSLVSVTLPGTSPSTLGQSGSSTLTIVPQTSSAVSVRPLGSSLLSVGIPGPSPVATRLPSSSPAPMGVPGTPLSAEMNPVQTKDTFVRLEKPEGVTVQPLDISLRGRKYEGGFEQSEKAGGITAFTKVPGEKKCKKSTAKLRTVCDVNNFHKPYRCVHKDCSAAFTIQQNLILHYRAVHQFDQQLLHTQIKQEINQSDNIQVKEFQCQIAECCRIFQGATDLIEHYSGLHNLATDEIGKIMSSSDGKFHCDQAQCTSSFTVFWNFVKHLLVAHGIDVESPQSDADAACFKCDCKGCDRTYATRSNLLRHIFTKHRELHQSHLMRPRRIIPSDQENFPRDDFVDGRSYLETEELSESEDAMNQGISSEYFVSDDSNMKSGEIDDKLNNPRKVGRYTFKSKIQALAMCSSKSPKEQYPCMFENCSSIVTSEHSLVKHYRIHHKISSAFVSQYHNHLITCRRYLNVQGRKLAEDIISHEEGSVEYAVSGDVIQWQIKPGETEMFSKKLEIDTSFRSSVDEFSELLNAKRIKGTGSTCIKTEPEEMAGECKFTDVSSHQLCKKRSGLLLDLSGTEEGTQNKRKKKLIDETPVQLLKDNSNQTLHQRKVCPPKGSPCTHKAHHHKPLGLSTFKPMGFEFSFLKFLEESARKQKKKALTNKGPTVNTEKMVGSRLINSSLALAGDGDRSATKHPVKKDVHLLVHVDNNRQPVANKLCDQSTKQRTLANYATPLSVHILKNIKFKMDKADSNCVELTEKQLQHMQPTVVLKRVKVDFNMLAQVKSIKERLAVKST
ncbi:zinc finger protein 292 isoform X3 [Amblyraja radiata]|uniref:zinc finger protein 292 isoform X3 n=1 Tax=Amblyraja radiata TaxID=386614 RepID=UPI0014034C2F|nr:zinc finger protein 292 isoform X3 [Amblyraja radiata]